MRRVKNFLSSLFSLPHRGTEKARLPKPSHSAPGYQAYPVPRIQPVLSNAAILPDAAIKVNRLTESPIWDWAVFRGVLICLATMRVGRYLSVQRQPENVCLDGLYPIIADLRRISAERQGRETSRIVFADRDRSCLVDSGKTHIGARRTYQYRAEPKPGRRTEQVPVLAIHVHPSPPGTGGLADQDYVTFLSDPRQIILMICHSAGVVFAMKTSATRIEIGDEAIEPKIALIRKDICSTWKNLALPDSILALNKAICMEFGMTLYQAVQPYENKAWRIEVANV
jgi:hypothetical protein